MKTYKCLRCKHRWDSRIPDKPTSCPKCKSYFWDSESDKKRPDLKRTFGVIEKVEKQDDVKQKEPDGFLKSVYYECQECFDCYPDKSTALNCHSGDIKPIDVFICITCNKIYDTLEKAVNCSNTHKKFEGEKK